MSVPRRGSSLPRGRSCPAPRYRHRRGSSGSTPEVAGPGINSQGIHLDLVDLPELAASDVERGHSPADQFAQVNPSASRVERNTVDRSDSLARVEFLETDGTSIAWIAGLLDNPECVLMRTVSSEIFVTIVQHNDRGIAGLFILIVHYFEPRHWKPGWRGRCRGHGESLLIPGRVARFECFGKWAVIVPRSSGSLARPPGASGTVTVMVTLPISGTVSQIRDERARTTNVYFPAGTSSIRNRPSLSIFEPN